MVVPTLHTTNISWTVGLSSRIESEDTTFDAPIVPGLDGVNEDCEQLDNIIHLFSSNNKFRFIF